MFFKGQTIIDSGEALAKSRKKILQPLQRGKKKSAGWPGKKLIANSLPSPQIMNGPPLTLGRGKYRTDAPDLSLPRNKKRKETLNFLCCP